MSKAASWAEKLWYQRHPAYWLLVPLSALYALVTALRRWLFRVGLKQQITLPVPVIVVGNISVGGTGKTPFTLYLVQLLQQRGFTPGIISRGYGAKIDKPTLVTADASADAVGDEPLLLAQKSGCPVVVCPDRVAAAQYLLAHSAVDIMISDDGLQHYRLGRAAEIVLIDGSRALGNGQLLPAGPLREGRWRLQTVDLVVANSQSVPGADGVMQLVAAAPKALVGGTELPAGSSVTLVAGIGNPARFERTAQAAGYQIKAKHYFADHHHFSQQDFAAINGPVLMTEKDAVKCRPFAADNWFSLGVQASLDSSLQTKLEQIIATLRS